MMTTVWEYHAPATLGRPVLLLPGKASLYTIVLVDCFVERVSIFVSTHVTVLWYSYQCLHASSSGVVKLLIRADASLLDTPAAEPWLGVQKGVGSGVSAAQLAANGATAISFAFVCCCVVMRHLSGSMRYKWSCAPQALEVHSNPFSEEALRLIIQLQTCFC